MDEKPGLMIVSPFPPDIAYGGGQRLYGIIKALELEYRVVVLVLQEKTGFTGSDGFDSIHFFEIDENKISALVKKVIPFFCFGYTPLRKIVDALAKEHDVSLLLFRYPRALEKFGGGKKGIPVLLDIDDIEFERKRMRAKSEKKIVEKVKSMAGAYLALYLFKKIIKTADQVWVVKKEDLEIVKHINVRIVPNVAFTANQKIPYTASLVEKTKNLLYVAHFAYPPNREGLRWFLAEVWPLVVSRNSDAFLNIVGVCKNDAFVKFITAQPHTRYLGFVPSLDAVYRDATVCINPCGAGSGTQIKVIEAMCYGRVVVTTGFGARGWADLINACGCPVITNSVSEFAALCCAFLEDDEKRHQMECNIVTAVKAYGSIDYLRHCITSAIAAVT